MNLLSVFGIVFLTAIAVVTTHIILQALTAEDWLVGAAVILAVAFLCL
jgi:hypothetical protein